MGHRVFGQIWRVFYPILIYFVTGLIIVAALRIVLSGVTPEEAARLADSRVMEMNIVKSLILIPLFLFLSRKDRERWAGEQARGMTANRFAIVLLMALCGNIAFNNLITLSGLAQVSGSFQETQAALYHSGLFVELLGAALFVPMMEELLFRGLVYQRLKAFCGVRAAAVFSALLFGLCHGNVVQGLYAFALGLAFACMLEECKSLAAPIVAHMAANGLSVLSVELGALSFQYQSNQIFLGCTAGALALFFIFGIFLHKLA